MVYLLNRKGVKKVKLHSGKRISPLPKKKEKKTPSETLTTIEK